MKELERIDFIYLFIYFFLGGGFIYKGKKIVREMGPKGNYK